MERLGINMTTLEILQRTRNAKNALITVDTVCKNKALLAMADALLDHVVPILHANEMDMDSAKGRIADSMLDRLLLTEARIGAMAEGIRAVAALPDPVGSLVKQIQRPNGLLIEKRTVPMGLIAIIYESRPNVTADAAALAIKAGSACVLRCGRDAWRSCQAIVEALRLGLVKSGLPAELIGFVEDTTHESARELMTASGLVDLLIPRGGKRLIESCVHNATVPCIQTGTGICHIFVDETADQDMTLDILVNAKTSRPSVCNAMEVCLVHQAIAADFLPKLCKRLVDDRVASGKVPVELRLDQKAQQYISGSKAGTDDFDTEFLDYILAIGIVEDADCAIGHICEHSTHHSDGIISKNAANIDRFISLVDSAAVYVNASTRFTDGGEFGLGCEMGISTQKLHARGPMGLEELCSYKYIIHGEGQIR